MKQTHISAGVIPVRRTSRRWEFLILRAFSYWDFPKGMIETGEEAEIAAVRELEEETGISQVEFTWGEEFVDTEPYGKCKVARYFLAQVKAESKIEFLPNPVTGIVEHHEFRWASYEEARDLLVPRVQNILDWAHKKINEKA